MEGMGAAHLSRVEEIHKITYTRRILNLSEFAVHTDTT